jgi:hypothetical protein
MLCRSRHHALVQDAGDQNATGFPAIGYDVAALFHAPEAGANLIAGTTEQRSFGKASAARLDLTELEVGLHCSPGAERVLADASSIDLGGPGKTDDRQKLTIGGGEVEGFSDPRKDISFGDATRVAFVDGCAQSNEFRFILPLFPVQDTQCGVDNLAGVVEFCALDFGRDKAVQLIG